MKDDDRDGWFSAAAFLAALAPRLYVALAFAVEPVWDGHYYDFGARRIAEGHGYSDDVVVDGVTRWHPWCHYPVGYSGLLAFVYKLFGESTTVATVTNAIVGALLVVAVHRLALAGLGKTRARLAAILAASSPELVIYAALLMTEPVAALGMVAAAAIVAALRERMPTRAVVVAGLVLGLTTLVRPQSILGAPALVVMLVDPARCRASLLPALRGATLATAVAIATVAPWTIRNCRVMDGCAFVSTNAGWNLAIGAFERATGRFETLRATDGCPVVTGQVQQDRCWAKVGAASIAQAPGRFLSLVPKKLGFTFDHASFPMGYLGAADKARFDEPTKETGRDLLSLGHRLLLAVAAFAVVGVPRERRDQLVQGALALGLTFLVLRGFVGDDHPFWPLAVVPALVACLPLPGRPTLGPTLRYLLVTVSLVDLTHALFFGEDRYHVVLTPVFCVLAAAAFRTPDGDGKLA